jgi:hypothetical protein
MAGAQGIRAGRAYVELGVSDQLTKGLKQAQAQLKAFGAGLKSVGTGMMGIGAAALAPLAGAIKVFSDTGSALNDMSARTGVSVEALSEFEYAAKMTGVEMEGLEGGLRKMQKTVGEAAMGSKSAADALGKLGLSAAELTNLAPDQQFAMIADRLDQVRDPALRAAVAMEIFGKSGTNLLPMMQGGAAGVQALRDAARSMGLTMTTESAAAADALGDSLDALWMVGKRLYATIGEALAPAVTELAGAATRALTAAIGWVNENRQLIVSAAEISVAVLGVGAALYATGTAITTTIAIGSAVSAAFAGIGAALSTIATIAVGMLSPLGLVIAAVAGLGVYLVAYTGAGGAALTWLKDRFAELGAFVGKVTTGISDALSAGDVALAAQVMWAGVKVVWARGAAALENAWAPIKEALVTTWDRVWYSFAIAVENAVSGLKQTWIAATGWVTEAWINTVGFLSDAWAGFVNVVGKVWNTVQEWLVNRWIDLYEIVGGISEEQAAALKKMNREDFEVKATLNADEYQQKRKAILDEMATKRKGNFELQDQESTAEEKLHDQHIANLVAGWRLADAAAKAATGSGVAAAEAELQKAQDALDAALAQARTARTLAGSPSAPGMPKLPTPPDLDAIIARQEKLSVMSTFDVSAAWGFGAQSAQDKTIGRLDKLIDHVKRISDKVGVGMDN